MKGAFKFLAGTGFVLLASSFTAMAADLPIKAPVRSAPAAYNWNGFYIGAHAGYASQDPTVTFAPNDINVNNVTCGHVFGGTCAGPASFDIAGAFGGLQAGYNWQVRPQWLLGVEADYDWSRIKGDGGSTFKLGSAPSTIAVNQTVKSFGTLRGRVGYLPMEAMLVYATAGVAFGRIEQSLTLNSAPGGASTNGYAYDCLTGPDCFAGGSARSAWGYALGAGAEYALWRNISLKAEYLYVNLGHGDQVALVAVNTGGAANASSFTASFGNVDFHTARLGLNLKF